MVVLEYGKREVNQPMEEVYETFEEMYEKNFDRVYSYISRMVDNNKFEAEDLLQDVFQIAYERWDYVRVHPNIPAFLMLVAKHKLMKWKVRRRNLYIDDMEVLDALAGKEEAKSCYASAELRLSLRSVLSNEELDLLRYYYEYGYTAAEISEKLGVTETCFKARVARMKERVRNHRSTILAIMIVCMAAGSWRLL